ncbi:hypothetical protein YDYSY3_25450 [Paenibacillus chitinolyticus]|nr:hypothetical protein YDYSY3_25450 [Paenibacillus chitinolyticus]
MKCRRGPATVRGNTLIHIRHEATGTKTFREGAGMDAPSQETCLF